MGRWMEACNKMAIQRLALEDARRALSIVLLSTGIEAELKSRIRTSWLKVGDALKLDGDGQQARANGEEMTIFQTGSFQLSGGQEANWKIECDSMSDGDWGTLARLIVGRFAFSGVTGVPRGGLKLAALLQPHVTAGCINHLIVDDVYTTGGSIRRARDELIEQPDGGARRYLGIVVFAREGINKADAWVHPMFQFWR